MQIIADLHTHTNVTDHAFSTLTEMVQAAHDMGLKAIAITNHGPPTRTARMNGIFPI